MGNPGSRAIRQLAPRLMRLLSRNQGKAVASSGAGGAPTPPAAPPEDKSWTAGDQAECLNETGWGIAANVGLIRTLGPAKGQIFTVVHVMMLPHPKGGEMIFLGFRGCNGLWEATQFRKLQPVADKAEAADGAFLRDLHRRLSRQPEHV